MENNESKVIMETDEKPKINHFVYMGGITPYTIRQLILSKSEALIEIIEREAEGGNWKAADALLRYAMPAPPVTYQFELPDASSSVSQKICAILDAIATGRLPPIDGARLLDALGRLAQADAIAAIEQKMEEITRDSKPSKTLLALDAAIEELSAIKDRASD